MEESTRTRSKVFAVRTRISSHAHKLRSDLIDQRLFLVTFDDSKCTLKDIIYQRHIYGQELVVCEKKINVLAN